MISKAEDRKAAVIEARKRYVDTGIEKNITEAFRRYVKEEGLDFPVVITRESKYNPFPYSLRPWCPVCRKRLYLDLLNTTKRNQVGSDGEGVPYKSSWVCADEKCGYIGDWTTLTPAEWRGKLEKERDGK